MSHNLIAQRDFLQKDVFLTIGFMLCMINLKDYEFKCNIYYFKT